MPASVPSISFQTDNRVSPAAYETRSDDVSGLIRSKKTTHAPRRVM